MSNINSPKHYNSSPAKCPCGKRIECISVVRHYSFNIGNIIKYLWRHKHKNRLEDLKKAQWYLNDEINQIELLTKRSKHDKQSKKQKTDERKRARKSGSRRAERRSRKKTSSIKKGRSN